MISKKKHKDKEDVTIKSVFEKVLIELRNIEYCLEHYIKLAAKNEKIKFSRIVNNESSHLNQTYDLEKKMSNEADSDM